MKASLFNKQGSTLFSVIIITVFVVSAAGSLIAVASQQAHAVNRQRDIIRAKSLAEAGAHEAYGLLKADFDNRNDESLFPRTSFGGGEYDVTVSSVGDTKAIINSTGYYDGSEIEVMLDVELHKEHEDLLDPEVDPFAHTVYAAGEFRCNGSGSFVGNGYTGSDFRINGSSTWDADVMARSSATVIGGSSVINGEVWAPSIGGSGAGNISEPQESSCPAIAFPGMDLTEYYNIAVANSQVFSGSNNADGNIGVIPGGVRWYDGNVKFKKAATYTGCIIATGYIIFNGGVTQARVGDLPAVISRDSYIKFNGTRSCAGLVYAAGDVTFNGSGTLAGTVISGGDVVLNGSYGSFSYAQSIPGTADSDLNSNSSSANGTVAVNAWQK